MVVVVVGAAVVTDAVVVVVVVKNGVEERPVNRSGENNGKKNKKETLMYVECVCPDIFYSGPVKPLINHLMNNLKPLFILLIPAPSCKVHTVLP